MEAKLIPKLQKALKENIEIISFVEKDKDFYKKERALFTFLYDHPKFQSLIIEARRKIGVPPEGFSSIEQSYKYPINRRQLRSTSTDIADRFNIQQKFFSGTLFYIEDLIISESSMKIVKLIKMDAPSSGKIERDWKKYSMQVPALRSILTTDNPAVNATLFLRNTLYLEITNDLSKSDLQKFLNKFKKGKKNRRIFVPTLNPVQRFCWRKQSLNDKVIAQKVSKIFRNGRIIMPEDVRKERNRYSNTLKSLLKTT